jgi:hypothetical protein
MFGYKRGLIYHFSLYFPVFNNCFICFSFLVTRNALSSIQRRLISPQHKTLTTFIITIENECNWPQFVKIVKELFRKNGFKSDV